MTNEQIAADAEKLRVVYANEWSEWSRKGIPIDWKKIVEYFYEHSEYIRELEDDCHVHGHACESLQKTVWKLEAQKKTDDEIIARNLSKFKEIFNLKNMQTVVPSSELFLEAIWIAGEVIKPEIFNTDL